MFDRGCREGWLARELNARKIDVVGLDGTAQLVEVGRGAVSFALSLMRTSLPDDSRCWEKIRSAAYDVREPIHLQTNKPLPLHLHCGKLRGANDQIMG